MTKTIEAMEKKIREAKTANGFVSAVQKYLAAGGSPSAVEECMNTSSFSFYPDHLIAILFFHCYANKQMNKFGDNICETIRSELDFNQKISLANIISEFKSKNLAVSMSEEAFSEIEGTSDYFFFALGGLSELVSNTIIEAIDGNGAAPLSIGDKSYKNSTIQSILEDVRASKDSFSVEEYVEHLVSLSRSAYLAENGDLGDEVFLEAVEAIKNEDMVDVVFYEIGELSVPGQSVYDPLKSTLFPSERVRPVLISLAKKKMNGDDLENILSQFSE